MGGGCSVLCFCDGGGCDRGNGQQSVSNAIFYI